MADPHATPYKILVAEDNPLSQTVTQRQLERLGYQAEVAHNGLEAVKAAQNHSFDLILMDCHMPEMDGYLATAAIRKLEGGSHTPIVAVTAYGPASERETCLAAGMDDYFGKPLLPTDLQMILQRWLKPRSACSPIDMSILRDVTGDSWEGIRYLTDIYLESTQKSFEKITLAIQEGNARSLQMAAHGCAGSSASFGAAPLAELLRDLEMMGKAANLANASSKVAACLREYERLVSHLEEMFRQEEAK
jgi:CheY-like chemotaxis protein/HPt (histidine-containing phosphotransfer) domain-containing protein